MKMKRAVHEEVINKVHQQRSKDHVEKVIFLVKYLWVDSCWTRVSENKINTILIGTKATCYLAFMTLNNFRDIII